MASKRDGKKNELETKIEDGTQCFRQMELAALDIPSCLIYTREISAANALAWHPRCDLLDSCRVRRGPDSSKTVAW